MITAVPKEFGAVSLGDDGSAAAVLPQTFVWHQAAGAGWESEGWRSAGFETQDVGGIGAATQGLGAHFLHFIPKFPWIYITKWSFLNNKCIKLIGESCNWAGMDEASAGDVVGLLLDLGTKSAPTFSLAVYQDGERLGMMGKSAVRRSCLRSPEDLR